MPGQGRQGRSDAFQRKARREGYRARSTYKLKDIQKRSKIFKTGDKVLDLGAAPGGWSQVALEFIGEEGKLVGVDLQHILPLKGALFLQGDLREKEIRDKLHELMPKADVVISDMSPNLSGNYSVDQARSVELSSLALEIAAERMASAFVVKVFEGADFQEYRKAVIDEFGSVRTLSPEASRKQSSEVYLIAKRKRR
ncbi:MAG: RlmE family RNA methyltransferase [Candidatus Thermoplasmatota archaeon]|jgi:23S rRNA (uridine2552-2'-O)-methyltransferase|nr:RlmE family RNA methyltransferase [Candidatus Thermoplasmatota archaeon]MEC7493828.1 RlmE family RNA methyltransferase [Candidatus Thermoplasmatota archaeon]MEC7697489.1 RlmE family RNA methyltransferase [Candidatus Thermoplasmatota archaeon]MEC8073622.1 RlmE family RNA methyltransferase [Candidatus Thermoplasmatota archaeon]MEC8076589.1 RlmE family RNA methyltransferase [Candidatus Thermoplasmatota archaeon]|tara:strand:- start:3292 stop:3882 length:591 start_codon:yes stop_codon:yes gene_type:complete